MLRAVFAVIVILGVLYVLYVAADRFLKVEERRRLESRHAEGEGGGLNREDFVQKGMADYERSTQRRLLMGLFALPIVVIGFLAMLAK
ncbi:MAG: hypothetical protein AAFV86_07410 [Pseudomonadota bacterium]